MFQRGKFMNFSEITSEMEIFLPLQLKYQY